MFNKQNYKKIFLSISLFYIIFLLFANLVYAGIGEWDEKLDVGAGETEFYETYKEGEGDVASQRIVKYIGGILALAPFLGIHFIIRIVIAGYEWMTAGGSSEKIEIAKKRIKNAIIIR